MKDTDMKSNSVNIDAKELFELTSLFRSIEPHERVMLKRMMLALISDKKQAESTNPTARVYQFKQAI